MSFSDAKQRFSNRVTDYVRYRPGYPAEILPLLKTWTNFRAEHIVADIGSGTGLLSKLFLDFGNRVPIPLTSWRPARRSTGFKCQRRVTNFIAF